MARSGVQGPAAIGERRAASDERRARAASGDPISKSIMSRPCITKIFGVARIVLYTLIILMAGYAMTVNVMAHTFGLDIYFYGLGLFVIVNVSMYLCLNYVRCRFGVGDSTVDGDVKSPLLAVAHHPPPHPIVGVAVQAGGGNRNISKSIMSRPCITKIFDVVLMMLGTLITWKVAQELTLKFGFIIAYGVLGLIFIFVLFLLLCLNYVESRYSVCDSAVDGDAAVNLGSSPSVVAYHPPPLSHPVAGVAVQIDRDLQDLEKRKKVRRGVAVQIDRDLQDLEKRKKFRRQSAGAVVVAIVCHSVITT